MDVITIAEKFKTQESCIEHLENVRWRGNPVCPYCNFGGARQSARQKATDNRHTCNWCNKSFSVLVGTIFQNTKLPLQKWFVAISLMLNAKTGMSTRQLARDIKVTKDTAWYLQMRIREAMTEHRELLTGIVEIDETCMGGKPRKATR